MTIQQQIDNIKVFLDDAQTAYSHAIAANDMAAMTTHRKAVGKYRNMIGKLVKQKLNAKWNLITQLFSMDLSLTFFTSWQDKLATNCLTQTWYQSQAVGLTKSHF